jgi:DNA/RNA endonuclease G (NUC1)
VAEAASTTIVISQFQVAGDGVTAAADEFVELHNISASNFDLNGHRLVYRSATGTSDVAVVNWTSSVIIPPGGFYLIAHVKYNGAASANITFGTTAAGDSGQFAGAGGGLAIRNGAANTGTIIDSVGFGTATNAFVEGTVTSAPPSNDSRVRTGTGCADTNNNSVDFAALSPAAPRNSSTAPATCGGGSPTNPTGIASANPVSLKADNPTTLTVNVTPGANIPSTGITVTGDLSSIGGSSSQAFSGVGNTFSFVATVAANTTPGLKIIPITIADAQSRSSFTSVKINVQPESLDHVIISQVYGGGGNAGATLTNDFIELYNPTVNTVNLSGWSVQYASASGSSWTETDLSGAIEPGAFYLIQEAKGTGGSVTLTTPNAVGTIPMSATDGKVALVSNSNTLSGTCPNTVDIVDLVGYGSANCFEGLGATAVLTNTTAALRKNNGSTDTDNNTDDFTTGTPNPRFSTGGGGGGGGAEVGPSVSTTSPSKNGTNVLIGSNITVNFNEPVTVDNGWFSINCSVSGLHAATFAGGPTSFNLDPTNDFANSEQCTVTISANLVSDQDANDPPDHMSADYIWTFTTVSSTGIVRDPNEHLVMGLPSGATAEVANENDYLMKKPEYALSYNRGRAIPNWTSWHLDSSWRGSQARTNTFRADPDLPASWYHVNEFSYSGSGFDRGHMTPSADRTFNAQENAATFLMTNMIPQAPNNNQVTWEGLESYARSLLTDGNEVYIISGGYGQGGTGSGGGVTQTIDQGRIVVPAKTWKVLLVLPNADGNDVARVTTSTRTIAVIMPNAQGINADWRSFLVSVDDVEALTGYDFFSNVPEAIQSVIEANRDGNTRPVANAQTVTVQEGGSKAITLTGTDADNNPLAYTITSQPSHGTLGGGGTSYTYTPDANYNGPDNFTFTVKDAYVSSEAATVSINVTEVNQAVVVANDSKNTAEDTALSFPASDLTVNDNAGANEGGQTLTVTNVIPTLNTHGTVALVAGQVTYTPEGNYNGPASFDYQVCDDGTTNGAPDPQCGTGVVNITVDSVNDNPVAVSDSATTDEDTPVTINVVGNDTDSDGGTPALDTVGSATNGSVSIESGKAVFSPATDYSGPGSFSYTVIDGQGGSATGSVTVTINPVNDAPSADSQAVTIGEDSPAGITLTGSDIETPASGLSFELASNPLHGTLSGTGANQTYTPNGNFSGTDSFTFKVTDTGDGTSAALTSSEATVSITVTAINDAPTAGSQSVSTDEDTPKSITLGGSDVETEASGLSYTVISFPAHGTLTGEGPNLSYAPEANYYGPDSFQFTVRDTGDGSSAPLTSAPATVSITVNPVNDAPVANAGTDQTVECSGAVTLSGSAFDQEGDSLSYQWREGITALGSTATVNTTLAYGPHTITLRVTDMGGASSEDTVLVNVVDTTLPTIMPNNLTILLNNLTIVFNNQTVRINGFTFPFNGYAFAYGGQTFEFNGQTVTINGQQYPLNGQTITIWQPDKKYHQLNVADLVQGASDSCDASVNLGSVVIAKVTSDEGSIASNDVIIGANCKSVQLRADRNNNGNGRVYTISFRVRDSAGNTKTLTRQVTIPKGNLVAVDSGVAYTVTSGCP